jgi:NADH:ubiquinone oxidoreductase subunit 6 (subunit J)
MLAVEWVAAHAVEVLAVTALCGAVAVAAVVALMRWGDRRERRHMSERPFLVSRTVADLTATVIPQVTQGTPAPAIENHYHIHLDPADREAARLIRQALPAQEERR